MQKYIIVKKRIDEMDYLSLLSGGAPDSEFDNESKEICEKITLEHTENDIAQIIAKVFNSEFGRNDKPDIFMECASKVYNDLKELKDYN